MATATAKFTPSTQPFNIADVTQSTIQIYGTITFSAVTDTYATHGLVLSGLTGLVPSSYQPIDYNFSVVVASTASPSGYTYYFSPSATGAPGSGNIAIMNGTTEFSNGSAITAPFADVIDCEFTFIKL